MTVSPEQKPYRCIPSDPCGACDFCADALEEASERTNGQQEKGDTSSFDSSLLTSDEITDLPAPEWLIRDYLVRDTLALLFGPSGACKTFLSTDWALHVATGSWWNGCETRAGGVLYVIAEGAAGMGRRLEAWKQHHRIYELGRHQPVLWRPNAVNLTDLPQVMGVCAYVERHRPALVVFDTLARCTLGAEENSAKDMGLVVANLDRIRRASGACVLAVHHTGKDGAAGARGSSAVRAAVDTELEITAVDHRLTLKVSKQKDAEEARPLRLDRLPVAESCVLVEAGKVTVSDELGTGEEATLEALRSVQVPGGVPAKVWEEAATETCSRRSFWTHRSRLLERGMVQNVGTDARPRYVVAELHQTDHEETSE